MKIGILKADNVRPELAVTHGEYPAMFQRLFQKVDPHLEFVTYDIMHFQYPISLDEVDAFLITGSARSVYESEEWIRTLGQFIKQLDIAKKKTIGICFGHQLIAHSLGGETKKSDYGWHIGTRSHVLNEKGIDVVGATDHFKLPFSHQDQVVRPAIGSQTLASTEACPIAMSIIGDHIISVQGHPEFEKDYARGLIELRQELFEPSLYSSGIASLEEENDRFTVAQWLLDFIRE